MGSSVDYEITDLLIDSRRLMSASKTLFFALTSERNDGHKYLKDLYDNGVRAVALGRMEFRDSQRVVFRLHEVDRPVRRRFNVAEQPHPHIAA